MKFKLLSNVVLLISAEFITCSSPFQNFSRNDFGIRGSVNSSLSIPLPRSQDFQIWREVAKKVVVTLFDKAYEGIEQVEGNCLVTIAYDDDGYKAIFSKNLDTGKLFFKYEKFF